MTIIQIGLGEGKIVLNISVRQEQCVAQGIKQSIP